MASTAILTEDTATIVSDEPRQFHWGAAIAGAIGATATFFFLATLGSGVGLAIAASSSAPSTGSFLTMGAIYLFAAQAFGFAVGGYLVGRLIGPEAESSREEEFRAAAHGFTVWGLAVLAGLLIAGFTTVLPHPATNAASASSYWQDVLFRPASNTAQVAADKAEVGRIWVADPFPAVNSDDNSRIVHLVAQDAGLSTSGALNRVQSVQDDMRADLARKAKAATYLALWTAFSLLFGAIVSVAAAISARWMDDKVSFGFGPRIR